MRDTWCWKPNSIRLLENRFKMALPAGQIGPLSRVKFHAAERSLKKRCEVIFLMRIQTR